MAELSARSRDRADVLEHDPEKWIPVFGRDHAQNEDPTRDPEKWIPVFGRDHAQNEDATHDPEKWIPAFGRDHAQTKNLAHIGSLRPQRRRWEGDEGQA